MRAFCERCGEIIYRFGYKIPSGTEEKKEILICNRCLQENYRVELEEKKEDKE